VNNIKDTRRADRDVKTRIAVNVRNAMLQKGLSETDLAMSLRVRDREARALWAGKRSYVVKHLPPLGDLLGIEWVDVPTVMFKGLK
jgi:ribosome-binding protein aMBF1 (putative translation factor)